MSLNPEKPESFPEGLIDALDDSALADALHRQHGDDSIEGRLRAKMRADALQPLISSLEDENEGINKSGLHETPYAEDDVEEAAQFLRLTVRPSPGVTWTGGRIRPLADILLIRPKIDWNWSLTTCARNTHIASGVAHNMMMQKTWTTTVLAQLKTIMTEAVL